VVTPFPAYYNPFPAPFQIPYFVFDPNPLNVDAGGNVIPVWNDSVLLAVQGWDILSSVHFSGHQAQERFDAFLETPATQAAPQIRDRFGLPLPSNSMVAPTVMFPQAGLIAPGIFEVVGYDSEAYGFSNWSGGNVVLLKEWTA
jgi:hypothetical protein